jgi:hypothetical protein
MTKYSVEHAGGACDWFFITCGKWIEGGDMTQTTAEEIAKKLNEQQAEIERLQDMVERAQRLLSVCEFDDENDLTDLGIVLGDRESE